MGLPGETRETIEETIRFAREIDPDSLQVSLAAPYPGTALYQEALEQRLARARRSWWTPRGVQTSVLGYPHLVASRDLRLGRALLPALLLPARASSSAS